MKNLTLDEENIIKDIRNLFTLKRELNYIGIRQKKQLKIEYSEILKIFWSMKR